MIDLILLLQADLDIQAAFARYEDYQAGRGEVFLRHLDAALALLRQHPELAPVYEGTYRRMLVRDFPYGMFYQALPTRIVVVAVMDLRQDPQSIRRKLGGDR
jgi:plasmid stabilization system protein ParE